MSSAEEAKQERDWQTLHDAITATLDRFGRKDDCGRGDYWLVDDNWGRRSHQLEFQNLALFKPHIIKALQDLLAPYPDWYIEIGVAVPEKYGIWPGMGLIVYSDEVVDELRRDFLPPEFRDVIFGTIRNDNPAELAERVRKLMKKQARPRTTFLRSFGLLTSTRTPVESNFPDVVVVRPPRLNRDDVR